ncbi:hypothetical protein A2V68_02560 [candidate division Kazan bacterium RBG_13_50_9]|uniref:Lactamase n=1 Tax=candidate division Kazan bacterium RBG_13_50_9 TaxID=1798535 RepID=A0A1F4NRI8_UNCK3|nr:MAG: hypothetical protein A2V68_02560 [candidate division Kazan bacterium RBG_13_50_9]
MEIKWFGHSCFQIKTKEGTIVTDPYSAEVGWSLPRLTADVLTISHDHFDHNAKGLVDAQRVFESPGEYEASGMAITGVLGSHDEVGGAKRGKITMFKFLAEGTTVLHLGDLGSQLSDVQLDEIGSVDIVLVPVGGNYTLDAKGAVEVVNTLEPKVVIPMHYKLPGLNIDIKGVDEFIGEIGLTPERAEKLLLSRSSLPEEGMRLIILSKSG